MVEFVFHLFLYKKFNMAFMASEIVSAYVHQAEVPEYSQNFDSKNTLWL